MSPEPGAGGDATGDADAAGQSDGNVADGGAGAGADTDTDVDTDKDTNATGGTDPAGTAADGAAGTDPESTATASGHPVEAVTGPPPTMAAKAEELTPMLSQYLELCRDHEDALVLFQVGDFYEAFCEAAEETARVCETTLTKREDSTGEYPMAGIPIDNAATYLQRLLDAGYRVAIADQVEDASEASGLVDRAVTRVITPGTLTDDDLLSVGTTYAACLVAGGTHAGGDGSEPTDAGAGDPESDRNPDSNRDDRTYALAAVDVSTGECRVTSGDRARVLEELDRLGPAELLIEPGLAATVEADLAALTADPMRTSHDAAAFDLGAARARLAPYVRPDASGRAGEKPDRSQGEATAGEDAAREARTDPEPVAREADGLVDDAERRAVGALLAYAEYTQGDDGPLAYVDGVRRYDPREFVRLDATALRSLELFESRGDRAGRTLMDVVDRTASALGRRRLEAWLRRPLLDRRRIQRRHGAVAALAERPLAREGLRDALRDTYDVERLVSRVSRGRANARDLRSLLTTLDRVPDVRELLGDVLEATAAGDGSVDEAATGDGNGDDDGSGADHGDVAGALLRDRREALDELADVRDLLREAIAEDPPQELTEGGVIRAGYDEELDELRATEREGREWVADLEARERERTGIDSLEVGHNKVHGYYIEVTNPNLDAVPDDYTRRQTLKNAERFYTPELKRREDEILGAAERADALEYELFTEVRARVAEECDRIQAVADALADVDALASFATVAVQHDYARPSLRADRGIEVRAGRHPVVERTTEFVPNDVSVPPGGLAVLTGPNMSGKSTYMRQVALTCVLAQAGSFVPAESADLPVVDRVFTRVGASDDIAGGQSTFMREMTELTEILHAATPDSLVLLDEVGRGTSTADGRAIARATAEFVHDEVRAHTLFATHYHDLTGLADGYERVFNLHFAADRGGDGDGGDDGSAAAGTGATDGDVTFLHRVRAGPASSSYGVEVAEMAGVPAAVVDRARTLVAASDGDATQPTLSAYADGDATDWPDGGDATNGHADGPDGPDGHPGESTAGDADGPPTGGRDRDGRTDPDVARVADRIDDVDLGRTTPIEALNLLAELKRDLDQ
jgi:DNA mismatch repair protein MutS